MIVRCTSCGTTYIGRTIDDTLEAYNPVDNDWYDDCVFCGCPTLEVNEEDNDVL